MKIPSPLLFALCANAGCDSKTARKWLNPELRGRMKPVVEQRIARAAVELGIVSQQAMAAHRVEPGNA